MFNFKCFFQKKIGNTSGETHKRTIAKNLIKEKEIKQTTQEYKKDQNNDSIFKKESSRESIPINASSFEKEYENGTSLNDGSKLLIFQTDKETTEVTKLDDNGLYKVSIINEDEKESEQLVNEEDLLAKTPRIAGAVKKIENDKYEFIQYYYDKAIEEENNPIMIISKNFNKSDIINFINAKNLIF